MFNTSEMKNVIVVSSLKLTNEKKLQPHQLKTIKGGTGNPPPPPVEPTEIGIEDIVGL